MKIPHYVLLVAVLVLAALIIKSEVSPVDMTWLAVHAGETHRGVGSTANGSAGQLT